MKASNQHRVSPSTWRRIHLIHILAKHATPMNARRTVPWRSWAMLSTHVMSTPSITVLLSADAIVKPPKRSVAVCEKLTQKMCLQKL